jgi:ribosomal protein S18 acetylase RimI-like enzyme
MPNLKTIHHKIRERFMKSAKRDIANFLECRVARPGDDPVIGQLLIKAFEETHKIKLPTVETCEMRKKELIDVENRRRHGSVYVLELGYRIVGTFSLIPPGSPVTQAWKRDSSNLRCVAIDPHYQGLNFSELLLNKAKEMAQLWKANDIVLHVYQGADGVARLYQRFGFVRTMEGDFSHLGYRLEAYTLPLAVAETELQWSSEAG